MKLFVFVNHKGAVNCYGIIAEDYEDALVVMGPDLRNAINHPKYPLELEKEFELKGGKRGLAFQVEE